MRTRLDKRLVLGVVGLAGAVALLAAVLVLAGEREPERRAAAPARPRGPAVSCGGMSAATCAERAVRARAEHDHPLEVEGVSCTLQPSGPGAFECDVGLQTTCDAYTARYRRGVVVVTRPPTAYCIQLVEESELILDE